MWHASFSTTLQLPPDVFRCYAMSLFSRLLKGVGKPELFWVTGQELDGPRPCLQIRRRLTRREDQRLGGMRNVRGTAEARQRILAVSKETDIPFAQLARFEPESLDPKCAIWQPDRADALDPGKRTLRK